MTNQPNIRLNKVLRELNISLDRVVEFLNQKGFEVEPRPTAKITEEVYQVLLSEFATDKSKKDASQEVSEEKRKEKESLRIIQEKKELERIEKAAQAEVIKTATVSLEKPKTLGKIDLDAYFGFASEIEGDKIKQIAIYADSQKLSDAFQTI